LRWPEKWALGLGLKSLDFGLRSCQHTELGATYKIQGSHSAKQLIGEIVKVGEPDEAYDAKVKVLSEYIKHHVKEEEGEIFPEVAGEEEELDELGQEMFARKAELMAESGMKDEMPDEMPGEAAARKKGGADQREARG